ncbi:MAG: MlaD family protein [Formivibrio sp.]|nr:MlaD family protein [Formivibrio sp.]
MNLLKDTDPRFRFLGWRVVFFGAAVLIVLLGLAFGIALKQGMFVSKTRLNLIAEHGAGFAPGMQVRFSGFRIGVVDKVALNEQAKVNVDLLIESRYMKWIKTDTTAQMLQDGLMGDYYLEMIGGSPMLPPAKEGDRINFAPAQSLADIAHDLKNRTIPIIDSVQATLDYVNDPKGDVRQTVANVHELTAELRETRARMDQLLSRVDGLANQEVRATLNNASRVLARADNTVADVQGRLPLILDHVASSVSSLDATARNASAMAATLRNALDEAAPRLPGIVRNTDELVRDSRDTLQGLQQSWPLNKMLTPTPLDAPVPDSRR